MSALMLAVPDLSARTVPLGVRVPSDRVDDPVVRDAVTRYRLIIVVIAVVELLALLACWSLSRPGSAHADTAGSPALAARLELIVVPVVTLLTPALGVVAMWWASCPLRAAKQEGRWYDGAATAVSQVAREAAPVQVAWRWHAAGLLLVAATGGYGVWRYPDLPDPMATHSSLTQFDRWEPKSAATMWMLPALAAIVVITTLTMSVFVAARASRTLPDGNALVAQAKNLRDRRASQRVLGVLSVAVAGILGCTAVVMWEQWDALLPVPVVGSVVLVVALVVSQIRRERTPLLPEVMDSRNGDVPALAGSESVDDDASWIWGVIYCDRDDPALFVAKRIGIGYTINVGHPAGMLLLGGLFVVTAAAVAVPLLAG
ncbi:DUF5808 domain-containing protein [Austwickia sp. TVS 96-490-7B]|uniref:DUF5808 domain-containing protein n=1 Tax=Austwickia sp. TVS 96-490-7B TaxID=2830843 RepID=UPI001C566182|nr:DUF5808 domain-containing protein [Austwickia sp. TVS 96-490-7B]